MQLNCVNSAFNLYNLYLNFHISKVILSGLGGRGSKTKESVEALAEHGFCSKRLTETSG